MTPLDDPREQLRVIRSLMERATIYRALSAPTALVGGLLSIGAWSLVCFAGWTPNMFRGVWLVVLFVTCACNAYFLWRGAVGRGENFFSPGMKTALVSIAPAFLAAGVFTIVVERPIDLCVLWIVLYGLGLSATQQFAPRSLVMLGRAFLVVGCVLAMAWRHVLLVPSPSQPSMLEVCGIMAAAFGGIHLLYAVVVWALGEDRKVEIV